MKRDNIPLVVVGILLLITLLSVHLEIEEHKRFRRDRDQEIKIYRYSSDLRDREVTELHHKLDDANKKLDRLEASLKCQR